MKKAVDFWVVYEKPLDFPTKFVLRKWEVTTQTTPTAVFFVADSLKDIRKFLPAGVGTRLERSPQDDKCIVESWV